MRYYGKDEVESKNSIRAAGLTRGSEYAERRFSRHSFKLGDYLVRFQYAELAGEWYLKLAEPWPECRNRYIHFIETKCNYGGSRQWFECPNCNGRAMVLYQGEYELQCRKCLNLSYSSQKMNYRGLSPTFRRMCKLNEMEPAYTYRIQFYKGKVTKRARRYWKLYEQVKVGMAAVEALGRGGMG